MSLPAILTVVKKRLAPTANEHALLVQDTNKITRTLQALLVRKRIRAHVFLGGSLAKGTLVKRESYDVDIFVRCAEMDAVTLNSLARIVEQLARQEKCTFKRIHGSRDYFQLTPLSKKVIFEIIPVLSIKKPDQAKNVTDLSYFHVAYVKKHSKQYADDIRLAKQFCKVQNIYGAESYIQGFSGYGLECLVIYYRGFIRLLRALSVAHEQLVLDPVHHYKNAIDARLTLNEAKTQNPLIIVDPTHKGRNVLAALNKESFVLFQKAARAFLKRPRLSAFEEKAFDVDQFASNSRKKDAQTVKLVLTTDRQAGDVAGTKLKKVSRYLVQQLSDHFTITRHHFTYNEGQTASFFLAYKPRDMIERRGPLLSMKDASRAFKQHHRSTFLKKGRLWARVPLHVTLQQRIKEITSNYEQMYNMGLTETRIENL